MNRDLDAGIPPVSVGEIAKDDPLVLPAVGQPPSAAGRISSESAKVIRGLLAHSE